ncbi:MAG: SemiSWEET family transporter [Coriobacteriia bacterium]|nr:SemiSWEET family transporter [Coriobacteriia bacterium]
MLDVRKTLRAPAQVALIGPRAAQMTESVAVVIEPHVNRMVMLFGIVYPLAMAPQLYNVWALNRTAGLSGITSLIGLVVSAIWTVYGLIHRQKPIWVANLVWIGVHAAMAAGILR